MVRIAKHGSVERNTVLVFALILVIITATCAAYQIFITTPASTHLREESLANELNFRAEELNALSQERVNLAVNLARRGEFFYSLAHDATQIIGTKVSADRVIGNELAKEVESFPFLLGAGIFFEPYVFDAGEKYRGFYAHWVPPSGMSRKVEFTLSKSTAKSDYHNSDWYRSLIPSGWNGQRHLYSDVAWTDPYRDSVTLVPMISIAAAMYSEQQTLIGLASVDWNLDQVSETITASRPTKNSVAVLFSPNSKRFAAVAGLEGLNLEPIDRARWMPYLLLNAPTDRFEMVSGLDEDGTPFRVYSRAINAGLIYSLIIPEYDILSGVKNAETNGLIFLALAFALAIMAAVFFCRRLLGEVAYLDSSTARYSIGDFSDTCKLHGPQELESIAQGLTTIRDYVGSIQDSCRSLTCGEHPHPLEVGGSFDQTRVQVNLLDVTIRSFVEDIEKTHDRLEKGEEGARLDPSKFSGFWRLAAKHINKSFDHLERPLIEAADVCSAAGDGDFSVRIRERRTGLPERVRIAINSAFTNHEAVVKQLRTELQGLNTSQEETGRSARMKSQLLARICSIFQNFLKNTLKTTALIRVEGLSDNQRNAVIDCRKSAASMLALTEELLGYAQIEQGQISVSHQIFDLHRVLFEVKDIVRPHVVKRRQEFRLTIDPSVPELAIGDPNMLKGALINVAMQSIRYTDEDGSVTVKAELVGETSDTYTIAFSVSDSSDSLVTRRGETLKSYSGDDSSLTDSPLFAHGLGLLIAERIVELLGGSLTQEAHIGVGGRCYFSIPLLRAAHSSKPTVINQDDFLQDQNGAATFADVLVVEDNVVNQKLAAALLKKRGCSVTIAGDGEEALRAMEQKKFDIVLMDIQLPLLDGFGATQRIRASGKDYSSIPIVALTAHALAVDDSTYKERGLDGYLLKPLEPRALWDVFAKFGIRLRTKSDSKGHEPVTVPSLH